jgi:hypothetical protein
MASMMANSFTAVERTALRRAKLDGWLTLTSEIGDVALARWQHQCGRSGGPFAVLRLEPRRATLWFVLSAAKEWDEEERSTVGAVLAEASGVILTASSVRAFAALDHAAGIMARLLALRGQRIVPAKHDPENVTKRPIERRSRQAHP